MPQNRKHIRLRDYDYSWENAYFITICTKDRQHFFCKGTPVYIHQWQPGAMLSPIGEKLDELFSNIPAHYPHAIVDELIIMPNHIHCIIVLDYSTQALIPTQGIEQYLPRINQFGKPVTGSISVIIGQVKTVLKKWCNNNGHAYFNWQPRFYDHVIRDKKSHEAIKYYIQNNPAAWSKDELFTKPPAK